MTWVVVGALLAPLLGCVARFDRYPVVSLRSTTG